MLCRPFPEASKRCARLARGSGARRKAASRRAKRGVLSEAGVLAFAPQECIPVITAGIGWKLQAGVYQPESDPKRVLRARGFWSRHEGVHPMQGKKKESSSSW